MCARIFILTIAVVLTSCGGCGPEGARFVDEGSGVSNERTLWPLHEGYTQASVFVDLVVHRLTLRAERERLGERVMPLALPGKTGGSVGRRPNEPATMTFVSRGTDGILSHGHLRQTHEPELIVPDTVRVGMKWTSPDGLREFEVIDRVVRPTMFGTLPVWTLRIYDGRQDFLKFASTDPQLENGRWIDIEFVEGFGPEKYVGDFRRDPGGNVGYVVVPLEARPTPEPENTRIALEPLDGSLDASILIENMHAVEVSPGSYELRMHGIAYGFAAGGGGVDGGFFAGWASAGVAYDPASRTLSESAGGFVNGLGVLAGADGQVVGMSTDGELPKPVADNCGANGTSNCFFRQVGLLRSEDGVVDQIIERPGYPLQPGLFLRRKVDEERYIGSVFGAFGTHSVIVTLDDPAGGKTFLGTRRDGRIVTANREDATIAAVSGFTEGTYGAVTTLEGRAFYDVSPDGRLARLDVEGGLVERVVLGDLEVPEGHLVEGALVIEGEILVVTNSGFTGVDAMIEDDVRLNPGISPNLGTHHFFTAKLPTKTTPGEHAAASVWVEPHQADMLVCWDPALGEGTLDGWKLGGHPASAVRVGPRDECVLLLRGPESRGDRYSEGAYRVEGEVPGAGKVMIGVSKAWASEGYGSWISRSYFADEGTVYEDGTYYNPGGRTGANGAPAVGFVADSGFMLPVSLGPEYDAVNRGSSSQCGGFTELVLEPDRTCCVRDGSEVTPVCHTEDEVALFVRDGEILALDEREGALVIIGDGGRLEVENGGVLDEVTSWIGDRICGVAMGVSGCLRDGVFERFEGSTSALVGVTPSLESDGVVYGVVGLGESLARFDLESMQVEEVSLDLLVDDATPDERWRFESVHTFDGGFALLYSNTWDTDRRVVTVFGEAIELLDRPEVASIGDGATLWVEEDMFVWIWPLPELHPSGARLDVLRLPR